MYRKVLIGIGALLVVLGVAAGAWYLNQHDVTHPLAAGGMPYQNVEYGFSLEYPSDLAFRNTNEGGGASTLTFESPDGTRGFEIFVVPYAQDFVSDERFKLDEPSGVRDDLATTSIDGVVASTFHGNTTIGPTYEVWFIHGGYLFEVATTRPLESWLAGIVSTMHFTQ